MGKFPAEQNTGERLKVFVSAGAQELSAECSAARQVIARMQLTPVIFDAGGSGRAAAHPPRELSHTYLPQCQVFVGIYWQQYGWAGPGEERSILEEEYDLSDGLPRLVYVKTPAPQRESALRDLLARIKSGPTSAHRYFSTPEELADFLEADLGRVLAESEPAAAAETARPSAAAVPRPPTNLPGESDVFIGRELQVEAIRRMLLQEENRLVPLTGPGGVGKTRLAIKAAWAALEHFPDGVFLIDLAALDDASLLPPAIARVLSECESAGEKLDSKLKAYLRTRRILLVLDNLDRLPEAAAQVAGLLAAAPGLKVLATSQAAPTAAPLAAAKIPGEIEFPVPPLGLPNPAQRSPEAIAQSEAVQLFLERAGSGLAYTAETAPLVGEICQRLGGLPLAIELIAARTRQDSLPGLLAQLRYQLGPITNPRDLAALRAALRAVLDWSRDWLEADEQTLLARMSVFRGSSTLEALGEVCGEEKAFDILSASSALVETGLVRRELSPEGWLRFRLPDTLHEVGLERLAESGEATAIQERHARYYLSLAADASRGSLSGNPGIWLERLDAQVDNLRAALHWGLSLPGARLAAELANALFWYWYQRGCLVEGQMWFERLLASDLNPASPAYASVLAGAGIMAAISGSAAEGQRRLYESIALLRADNNGIGERQRLAEALLQRAEIAINAGQVEAARRDLEESLVIFRKVGQRFFTAVCMIRLSQVALAQNQPGEARGLLAEVTSAARGADDRWLLATALNSLGEIARWQGDYSRAGGYYDDSGALFHEISAHSDLARILHNQGYIALQRGDTRLASSLFHQGLEIYRQAGMTRGTAECLAGLAGVKAAQGRLMPAARLFGFAQALIQEMGQCWGPADQKEIDRTRGTLQITLGEALFNLEETAGRSQKLENVLVQLE